MLAAESQESIFCFSHRSPIYSTGIFVGLISLLPTTTRVRAPSLAKGSIIIMKMVICFLPTISQAFYNSDLLNPHNLAREYSVHFTDKEPRFIEFISGQESPART